MSTPIRVMLVDDHEVVRRGLSSLIDAEESLEVVGEAGDGPEGVGLAGVLKPDVVVMDVRMPNGGGVEACREFGAQPLRLALALAGRVFE